MTLTRKDGDAVGLLLDEMRDRIEAGSHHLTEHRYVQALDDAFAAERCREEAKALMPAEPTPQGQRWALLDAELRILNYRIRLAIGV